MAFWETVTIAEMSVLLEEKERPDVREGWEKLSELIGATDPGRSGTAPIDTAPVPIPGGPQAPAGGEGRKGGVPPLRPQPFRFAGGDE